MKLLEFGQGRDQNRFDVVGEKCVSIQHHINNFYIGGITFYSFEKFESWLDALNKAKVEIKKRLEYNNERKVKE